MSFLDSMHWRYATKRFDSAQKLTDEQLHDLLESVRLAPTSFGLQPFQGLVIADPAVREQIKGAAMGQPQITDGSHLLVFAVDTHLDGAAVGRFIDNAAAARKVDRASLAARETQINGAVARFSSEARVDWAQKQAYLALGVLLSAAAEAGVDACPMEGFDHAKVDKILGLGAQKLTSTVVVVLGKRAADDPAAALPKVRKSWQELFTTV